MTPCLRASTTAALCATLLGLGTLVAAPGATAQSNRVEICHKNRTISVSRNAIPGHQRHGDTIGECPNPLEEMRELSERLMLSCAIDTDEPPGSHVVTGATMSIDITTDLAGTDLNAVSCPEALVLVAEGGCKELSQAAAPDVQTFLFACPSAADDAVLAPFAD